MFSRAGAPARDSSFSAGSVGLGGTGSPLTFGEGKRAPMSLPIVLEVSESLQHAFEADDPQVHGKDHERGHVESIKRQFKTLGPADLAGFLDGLDPDVDIQIHAGPTRATRSNTTASLTRRPGFHDLHFPALKGRATVSTSLTRRRMCRTAWASRSDTVMVARPFKAGKWGW
jgi:hypothetical protein